MTRDQLEVAARCRLADLPEHLIEPACMRALGVSVFCWTYLSRQQLMRLIGATVAIRLINDVDS